MKTISPQAEAREILLALAAALQQLSIDDYKEKIPTLSGSSIGEHTRHIIELFQQLLLGYNLGVVNYDDRSRNILLQENINFALENIAAIIANLCRENKNLRLATLYSADEGVASNYFRELIYNVEHCIHHQAIIKIGMTILGVGALSENFGVAKSTIAYKNQCAQ
jgi:hypothetical protein